MSDFELARARIEELLDFPVLVTEFENESEQRRLKVDKQIIGFKITTPPLTQAQYQTHRTFFTGKKGALTSFTFTNPFDGNEYNVRYKPGSFRGIFQDAYYTATFEFKVISAV